MSELQTVNDSCQCFDILCILSSLLLRDWILGARIRHNLSHRHFDTKIDNLRVNLFHLLA